MKKWTLIESITHKIRVEQFSFANLDESNGFGAPNPNENLLGWSEHPSVRSDHLVQALHLKKLKCDSLIRMLKQINLKKNCIFCYYRQKEENY